eukprot:TRINITY_DN6717_c1_g2_i1.p1 TRINITY_DN6717_c1_g2~~TRINITY_DN6717_c1_g2_i1.p1  ORF type:complete len:532 (-),score=123.72 TRINITY_DN6717_c1_g2_i1:682-2148(-)
MTADCYSYFLEAVGIRSESERLHAIKDLIETLPVENQRLLNLVVGFLYRLCRKTTKIPQTVAGLATIFGPILLRPRQQSMSQMIADSPMVTKVIAHMIESYGLIFSVKDAVGLNEKKSEKSAMDTQRQQKPSSPSENITRSLEPSRNKEKATLSDRKVVERPSKITIENYDFGPTPASPLPGLFHSNIHEITKQIVAFVFSSYEGYTLSHFGFIPQTAPALSIISTNPSEVSSAPSSAKSRPSSSRSTLSDAANEPRLARTTPDTRSQVMTVSDDVSDPETDVVEKLEDADPLSVANRNLSLERSRQKRPSDAKKMNEEQLKAEKSAIKRELRDFDVNFASKFGREPLKADKEVMRPLYQRYKDVKQLLDQKLSVGTVAPVEEARTPPSSAGPLENNEVYKRLKAEKRALQIKLHDYQNDYQTKNGRSAKLMVDQAIKEEYNRYKQLKTQLQQIETEYAATGRVNPSLASLRIASSNSDGAAMLRSTY